MMWLKYPAILLFFFVLALMQASFLPHASIRGVVPSIIFLAFFMWFFFQKSNNYYESAFFIIIVGFFLGVLSSNGMAIYIVLMATIYYSLKLADHFLKEREDKYLLVNFLCLFLLSFLGYSVATRVLNGYFGFSWMILGGVLYNGAVAIIIFYLYRKIDKTIINRGRQLKLF